MIREGQLCKHEESLPVCPSARLKLIQQMTILQQHMIPDWGQ